MIFNMSIYFVSPKFTFFIQILVTVLSLTNIKALKTTILTDLVLNVNYFEC